MNKRWKVVVIDDEPAARRILVRMMEGHNDLELIGEAENGEQAIAMINELHPDLLFLDIQLPDMTGFDVLKKVAGNPAVIFATAYDQYAINAFDELAIDYLLKPIREERFAKSIEKLNRFGVENKSFGSKELDAVLALMQVKNKPTTLPIKLGEKIILLPFENISFFEADDKYVRIITIDNHKYLTDQTLAKLLEKLPPEFVRVQKSYIINKSRIKELIKYFNGRFVFVMNDKMGSQIKSGLTFYDQIKSEFGL